MKVAVDDVGVLLDVDTQVDFQRFQQSLALAEWAPALLETADVKGRNFGAPHHVVVVGEDAVTKSPAIRVVGRIPEVLRRDGPTRETCVVSSAVLRQRLSFARGYLRRRANGSAGRPSGRPRGFAYFLRRTV